MDVFKEKLLNKKLSKRQKIQRIVRKYPHASSPLYKNIEGRVSAAPLQKSAQSRGQKGQNYIYEWLT
jgi:hypothetical protein